MCRRAQTHHKHAFTWCAGLVHQLCILCVSSIHVVLCMHIGQEQQHGANVCNLFAHTYCCSTIIRCAQSNKLQSPRGLVQKSNRWGEVQISTAAHTHTHLVDHYIHCFYCTAWELPEWSLGTAVDLGAQLGVQVSVCTSASGVTARWQQCYLLYATTLMARGCLWDSLEIARMGFECCGEFAWLAV